MAGLTDSSAYGIPYLPPRGTAPTVSPPSSMGETVYTITAQKIGSVSAKDIRFAASIGILGVVMFLLPPGAAVWLAVALVGSALLGAGPNPAAPIKQLTKLIYGG